MLIFSTIKLQSKLFLLNKINIRCFRFSILLKNKETITVFHFYSQKAEQSILFLN